MSDVTPEEWSANGLAALDHLDDLYYSGDGITVRDYRAATDAIRTALLASSYDRLVAIEKAARMYFLALDAPQPPDDDLDNYYETGPTTDEAERALRVALEGASE